MACTPPSYMIISPKQPLLFRSASLSQESLGTRLAGHYTCSPVYRMVEYVGV